MFLEDRYKLLKERTRDDYNDILTNANFIDGNVEELSKKIVISKVMADYVIVLDGSATDIEALLFYEKPVTTFYESCIEKDVSLLDGLMEDVDQFIMDRKHHLQYIFKNPQEFCEKDVEKAVAFMAIRENAIHLITDDEVQNQDEAQEQDDDMER